MSDRLLPNEEPGSIAGLSEGATLIQACLSVGRLSRFTSAGGIGRAATCLDQGERRVIVPTAPEKLRAARRSGWDPLTHFFLWAGLG
jgi:hypothetical protein